jgi:ribosomal peptide maturation radical SAM protein 1
VVSLPWNLQALTSSQVAGLKAYLAQSGFDVIGRHYHKDVVDYFDADEVSAVHEFGIGEHVFASVYFPDHADEIRRQISERVPTVDANRLTRQAARFVSDVVDDLTAKPLTLLGFTTTHVQLMASLCVARGVKERRPGTVILFGGLHLDEPYGRALLECFQEVDRVCVGEGEIPFRLLAGVTERGEDNEPIPRLVRREAGGSTSYGPPDPASFVRLAEVPAPDISDFFRHSLSAGDRGVHAKVCVESARGCVWGKCTFCIEGIRRAEGYRVKPAAKVVTELVAMAREANTVDIVFTDPDMSSRRDLFEAIAQSGLDLRLEAEVSGLVDLPTLIAMRNAGLRSIQIGIESFAPRLLRRFAKGVQLVHYVELMRWCRALGMELTYNIIVGAPFETQDDIDLAVATMENLWFLQPPIISEFVVSVGSPIHANYRRFGIAALDCLPETACYPDRVRESLGPLLSFHAGFDYHPVAGSPSLEVDHDALVKAVRKWWDFANESASCEMYRGPGFIDVEYRMGDITRHLHVIEPAEVAVLDVCRTYARSRAELIAHLPEFGVAVGADGTPGAGGPEGADLPSGSPSPCVGERRLEDVLRGLISKGLLFECDGRLLTLPVTPLRTVLNDAGTPPGAEPAGSRILGLRSVGR